MKNILHVIIISLFSLTVISCSSSTDNTSTTSSPLYISVGDNGTILTSSDGSTWTSRTSGITNRNWGVTYGNSTFVAVGVSGTILTSSDATTWTSRTSGTSLKFRRVFYKE